MDILIADTEWTLDEARPLFAQRYPQARPVGPDQADVDPAAITVAVTFRPQPGRFRPYPNLKLVIVAAAGIDHLRRDPHFPAHVPVVRLVDAGQATGIFEYVLFNVLGHQRQFFHYQQQQRQRHWQFFLQVRAGHFPVTVLGHGKIGRPVAERLAALGYPVTAWSRTPRTDDAAPGVRHLHGPHGLEEAAAFGQVLVCLLPGTPDLEGILNRRLFQAMPRGAWLVHLGRGLHLVEADLLAALDGGHLAGATLDVFRQEPLPPDHPFWGHERILITPHAGSDVLPADAVDRIRETVEMFCATGTAPGLADLARGY